ncbi:translation initiation factor IF-3 [Candidatus Babeliales bacterium]|nr:translation initiation factor IF-3 [Candidatus Babeliales bacterium]MCF7899426.1 translation initiation factor IF-3 [Candidatus Babeliales bacterium]
MNKFKDLKKMPGTDHFVNEEIRYLKIQVIDQDGSNLGVISKKEALAYARNAGMDLVQVGENDGIGIAKIMDFGKFLYNKKKQLNEAKKKQKIIQIKEVKLRPNIADQDYKTKLNHAIEFLKDGKKVKFTLQFRGREFIMMNELGQQLFDRINKDLQESNIGTLIEEKEQRGKPFWSKIYSLK